MGDMDSIRFVAMAIITGEAYHVFCAKERFFLSLVYLMRRSPVRERGDPEPARTLGFVGCLRMAKAPMPEKPLSLFARTRAEG